MDTDKPGHFLKEVLPHVLARYEIEPIAAIRERIEILIEGACVATQVRAEVYFKYHYDALEPYIRWLIAHGVNSVFNTARLAECLWALERTDEADAQVAAVTKIGFVPAGGICGVYSHRISYQSWEAWFLGARLRNVYRPRARAAHEADLVALDADVASFKTKFPTGQDVDDIQRDLDRYREWLTP